MAKIALPAVLVLLLAMIGACAPVGTRTFNSRVGTPAVERSATADQSASSVETVVPTSIALSATAKAPGATGDAATLAPTTNPTLPHSTNGPIAGWKSFTSPKYGYVIDYPDNMSVKVEDGGVIGDAVRVERAIFKLPNYGEPEQSSAITIEAAEHSYSRPPECQNVTELMPGLKGCRRSLPFPQGTSQELVWFQVPMSPQGQLFFSIQLVYDDLKYAGAIGHLLESFKYSQAADQPLLDWQGYLDMDGGDGSKCGFLKVGADNKLQVGYCNQTPKVTTGIRQEMVRSMFAHFAPFNLKTDKDALTFNGEGQVADPIWERAILEWVHRTFLEISTGHVCASCNTVFNWSLGELPNRPGTCKIVYVLAWGYANAGIVACKGGEMQQLHSDWLSTDEWKSLTSLTNSGAINPDTVDLEIGSRVPGYEKLTGQLRDWSQAVYDRLVK